MLGEKIRTLRQHRGLSIVQLAAELGLDTSSLGKYERSEREPDYDTIIKIANYFNVSIDWLLGRINNPKELSYTDIDITDLLKYDYIIINAKKAFEGSGLSTNNDIMFEDLLEILLKNGMNSAIDILKLQK
jgi:transcriptional regulator with XRE-family HTH domain